MAETEARDKWLFFAAAEQNFFQLKSRVRLGNKGDSNTGFFHHSAKSNLSRNIVHYLTDRDGLRVSNKEDIQQMVIRFYYYLQGRSNAAVVPPLSQQIKLVHPFRADSTLSASISLILSDDDIKRILFSLPRCKAPDPDGFTVEFFTSAWDLVGSDLVRAVKDFFISFILPRQTNATVLSLIPKSPGVSSLSDFRPISLCNTVYKVFQKFWAPT